MTRAQLLITIGFVVIVFVAAFLFTRNGEPQGAYIDRGDRHETAGQGSVLEEKIDEQGAVTVKVQPKEVSPSATPWEFEITLDTHSVELDDDLVAQSVLVDTQGNGYRPISWNGDPPGGHHRTGVLTFTTIARSQDHIRLVLRDIGGISERIFEWN